jgi:WD40 repeat protein
LNFLRLNEDGKTLEIWDAKTYRVIDSLESDEKKIEKIDISKDGNFVVGFVDYGLRKWDLNTKRILQTKLIDRIDSIVTSQTYYLVAEQSHLVKITNDLSKMAVSYYKGYSNNHKPKSDGFPMIYVMIYDFNTLDTIGRFKDNTGFTFRLSNTNKYIACRKSKEGYGLEIFDFNTKEFLWELPLNPSTITGYEFSPDDKFLVTASNNAEYGLQIWNIINKKLAYEYPKGSYNHISIDHKGDKIAISSGSYIMLLLPHFDNDSADYPNSPIKYLFPNPSNNAINLTFELGNPQVLNYSIFSETGQLIKLLLEEFTNPGTITKTFDVTDIQQGAFILKILGDNIGITYKVIITR